MRVEQIQSIIESHKLLIKRLERMVKASPVKKRDFTCLVENIIEEVNREFKVNCTEQTRKKSIVYARHAASYLLKKHTNLIWLEIATTCGNTDHSTAMNSYRTCIDLMATDEDYAISVNNIIKRLQVLEY
jgi:chromosomal replication initiation ATPase DnaA